jgi:hypothetical protein
VSDDDRRTDRREGRDVAVPMRLYKTVTVFSTLIAVFAVVFGFLLLDAAALGTGLLRQLARSILSALSLSLSDSLLSALFAIAGLLSIAAGAGVYVLGTRFTAEEMGAGDG